MCELHERNYYNKYNIISDNKIINIKFSPDAPLTGTRPQGGASLRRPPSLSPRYRLPLRHPSSLFYPGRLSHHRTYMCPPMCGRVQVPSNSGAARGISMV